jgi:hypothetical protein
VSDAAGTPFTSPGWSPTRAPSSAGSWSARPADRTAGRTGPGAAGSGLEPAVPDPRRHLPARQRETAPGHRLLVEHRRDL